jgi:hypothetical protein
MARRTLASGDLLERSHEMDTAGLRGPDHVVCYSRSGGARVLAWQSGVPLFRSKSGCVGEGRSGQCPQRG